MLRKLCVAAAIHSTVTAEQIRSAVLTVHPDAEASLTGVIHPAEAIDTDYAGRLPVGVAFAAGLCIRAPLLKGCKGLEAEVYTQVGCQAVNGILAVERGSASHLKEGVRYRLTLTRRIGHGRTQVWLVRPVDPAADERCYAANIAAGQVKREVEHQRSLLEKAEALAWAQSHIGSLGLKPIPGPTTVPRLTPPPPIEWEWCGDQQVVKVPRLAFPNFPDYTRKGPAIARWSGHEGRYERTVVETWSRNQVIDDDRVVDGHPGYITVPAFDVPERHIEGEDVVAMREEAYAAAQAAYDRGFQEVRSAGLLRRAAVRHALAAARDAIPVGEMPQGSPREAALEAAARAIVGMR